MTVEEETERPTVGTLIIMPSLSTKTITKSTILLSKAIILATKLSIANSKRLCGKLKLNHRLIILLIRKTQGTIKVLHYFNYIKLQKVLNRYLPPYLLDKCKVQLIKIRCKKTNHQELMNKKQIATNQMNLNLAVKKKMIQLGKMVRLKYL